MATPRKKPIPQRKGTHKVEEVAFELEGWDAPFVLPSMNKLTQKQQWAMKSGEIERLRNEVMGELADVIEDMTDDEVTEFTSEWAKASGVDLGESGAA